jgi:hypothetical protein
MVCAIAISLVGNAFAHKGEVIGDYKVEVGWKNEPVIVGSENAIEIVVSIATEHDKEMAAQEDMAHEDHDEMADEDHEESHDEMADEDHEESHDEMADEDHEESGEGVSGLANTLQAIVELDKEMTTLTLVESSIQGVYHGEYTPTKTGFPIVHLTGTIASTNVDVIFHPEEIESQSVPTPLKQIKSGVAPDHVVCKSEMELMLRPANVGSACVKHTSVEKLIALGWTHA